jgi:hypothetical protein
MELILTLAWWGFLLTVAYYLFNFLLMIVIGIVALIITGIVAIFKWIKG